MQQRGIDSFCGKSFTKPLTILWTNLGCWLMKIGTDLTYHISGHLNIPQNEKGKIKVLIFSPSKCDKPVLKTEK